MGCSVLIYLLLNFSKFIGIKVHAQTIVSKKVDHDHFE